MKRLLEDYISALPTFGRVLDLGAGQGSQAIRMADLGFHVEAVDQTTPAAPDQRVTWRIQTVESFVEGLSGAVMYDGILLHNIIQFLDKEWFLSTAFPKLLSAVRPNGAVAISTFWKDPEPPFRKQMRLYVPDEIIKAASDCSVLFSEQVTENANDLEGKSRVFHMTRVLLKKKR